MSATNQPNSTDTDFKLSTMLKPGNSITSYLISEVAKLETQLDSSTKECKHYKEMDALHIQSLGLKSAQPTNAVPEGYKLLKDTTFEERSWPEDSGHENGNYYCECCNCLRQFTGHKRRVVCKSCAVPTPGVG